MLQWARLLTLALLVAYPLALLALILVRRFGGEGLVVRWLRRLFAALAWAYPASLVVIALLFRFVGEQWWATCVALYLPRIGFAIPLPFIVMGLLVLGPRKLLWAQVGSLAVLVFPLMGFSVALPSFHRGSDPVVRVYSQNVDSGDEGYDRVAAEIAAAEPDIVLLQEVYRAKETLFAALRARYPFQESRYQFAVLSRHPIVSTHEPERIPFYGKQRSPRFIQHVIETPIGRLAVYNLHPISPREGLAEVRGKGLRREIRSGRLFTGANSRELQKNAALRELQVSQAAQDFRKEAYPAVMAGDTNLPALSRIYGRHLSDFQDGFLELGLGFGYTYPTGHDWMRIDRVLAGDRLRFVSFDTACRRASDHACVIAELQLR